MGPALTTPIVIFDLDDTLIDRHTAFGRWAVEWATRHGLGPEAAAWIVEADDDSDRLRTSLLDAAARRFDIEVPVDDLVDEFYREFPRFFAPDPAVTRGLDAIHDAGWAIGVATNGYKAQRPKMVAAGLVGYVDAVCVSREIGVSKPDPAIFHAVAQAAGATLEGGWMVGDSPTSDVAGGAGVGLRTIWISRGRRWPLDGVEPTVVAATIRDAFGILLAETGSVPVVDELERNPEVEGFDAGDDGL